MKRLASLIGPILCLALVACGGKTPTHNPSPHGSDKVTNQKPILLAYDFVMPKTVEKYAEYLPPAESSSDSGLGKALLDLGYSRRIKSSSSLAPYAFAAITAKGRAAGWKCASTKNYAGAPVYECRVRVGTMIIGPAKSPTSGDGAPATQNVHSCTPQPNDIGKRLDIAGPGTFNYNGMSSESGTTWTFGKTQQGCTIG